MFGFLKPEVSGFKNVLNGYFDFKARTGVLEDDSEEYLREFADYYYQIRLGPPLVRDPIKAMQMNSIAMRTAESLAQSQGGWSLIVILKGLLAAENMDWQNIDMVALRKLSFKYQPIPQEISGL